MPKNQVASVDHFEFGAPAGGSAAEATVLLFRVKDGQGGRISALIHADEQDLVVSLQTSLDYAGVEGTAAWLDFDATKQGAAGADLAVEAKGQRTLAFFLRAGVDLAIRVRAYSTGGGRGSVQFRPGDKLAIDDLGGA